MGISRKEKFAFVFAGFGQNMVITLVNTFLLVYLLEGVGFSAGGVLAITAIMTVARVWDAVNDPMMGVIVDKTRTRWGKLRPYILFTALPIAVLTIMLFSVPSGAESMQIIYFAVVYLLWETAYTMCDVPYWGLAAALSKDPNERTSVIAIARTFGMVALGLVTLFGAVLAKNFSGGEKATAQGWTYTAILIAVVGMAMFTAAFFGTKEKVNEESQPVKLKDILTTTVKCKPLLLVLLGSVLGFGRSIIQVGGAVFAFIVLGSEDMFTYLGAAMIVGMLVASLITPLITRKIGSKKLMLYSTLLSIVIYVVMYFVSYTNLYLFLAMVVLSGMMTGFFTVTQTTMIADCVDYMEQTTGMRNEGVCFSGLTFSGKLMNALATLAFGIVLTLVAYEKGVAITQTIKDSVFLSITVIPAVSAALSAIPFFFYPLK